MAAPPLTRSDKTRPTGRLVHCARPGGDPRSPHMWGASAPHAPPRAEVPGRASDDLRGDSAPALRSAGAPLRDGRAEQPVGWRGKRGLPGPPDPHSSTGPDDELGEQGSAAASRAAWGFRPGCPRGAGAVTIFTQLPWGGSLNPGHGSARRGQANRPEIARQLECPRTLAPRQDTGQRSRPPLRRWWPLCPWGGTAAHPMVRQPG